MTVGDGTALPLVRGELLGDLFVASKEVLIPLLAIPLAHNIILCTTKVSSAPAPAPRLTTKVYAAPLLFLFLFAVT